MMFYEKKFKPEIAMFYSNLRGHGDLLARSRLLRRRVPGSKPDSTDDSSCNAPAELLTIRKGTRLCGVEVRRGGASSSDRGSKWRDPCQNSPRVASKRDLSRTKLNLLL
ncbi:hypothetical protein AVEN_219405-1 [Araneus ventricosus]|uniref:Uncharacterized protein n=1 Tax=Araneus ventricosus TaxID=182803 RepID=A0A4Y1ZM37_ARAVE|nr:hypothetical protein AVEN_19906-1 [Araneus ventricosus]GBL57556.1 hypothetical protein AVEN_26055-1 [Araneus ventricosus]GBL57586.1 hypothetical protein AVEN_139278-1 [Araneus ventricosus]GBL57604.1 hypothetical protein AVEN_219405-1 [Araneus ventricosus]